MKWHFVILPYMRFPNTFVLKLIAGVFSVCLYPQASNAVVSISAIAAQDLETSTGASVPTGTLFALVAAPSGTKTFNISSSNTIAASSPLAVGDLLGNDTIFYLGTTTSTFANVNLSTFDATNYLGDSFAIVWFPTLTSSSSSVPAGTSYGVATDQTADGTAWVLPSSNSGNYTFGTDYTSLSAPLPANLTVQSVPEPSFSALAAVGVVGIFARRRRRSR